MKPRYYQQECIDSFWYYFSNHTGNPIAALPTGTGKSPIIAWFMQNVLTHYPNQRMMMLTHVKELIEQNFDKLLTVWPTAPAGIYSSGLKRRDTQYPITYAGIGSVAKRANEFGHIDLVVIDECHLVSPKQETLYRKFINALLEINPNLKVIGLTATPYRLKLGCLTEGGLFTDICYDLTSMAAFNRLVSEGYLAPLITKRTALALDTSGVGTSGGEFKQKDLQQAVDKDEITYAALKEMMEYGADRKHWLIFASGIEHAINIAEMLDSLGITCAVVHSKMKDSERDAILNDHKNGLFQCVVNNNILTTGYDFPGIDLIGVLRPTKSPGLWVQMLGRGTRPVYMPGFDLETQEGRFAAMAASHKHNCLVLDFGGNTKCLGPINDPVLPQKKGKKGGIAPVRICEGCGSYIHASLAFCPDCGMEFPREVKIQGTAYHGEVMASDLPQVEPFKVDKVVYAKHPKLNRPPSLKVTYYCGLRVFSEYICLEHETKIKNRADKWWKQRSEYDPPNTIDESLVLVNSLEVPDTINIWINKKYPEITGYEFGEENERTGTN